MKMIEATVSIRNEGICAGVHIQADTPVARAAAAGGPNQHGAESLNVRLSAKPPNCSYNYGIGEVLLHLLRAAIGPSPTPRPPTIESAD